MLQEGLKYQPKRVQVDLSTKDKNYIVKCIVEKTPKQQRLLNSPKDARSARIKSNQKMMGKPRWDSSRSKSRSWLTRHSPQQSSGKKNITSQFASSKQSRQDRERQKSQNIYKKCMDSLKKTFAHEQQSEQQARIKTLKQIGKYAQERYCTIQKLKQARKQNEILIQEHEQEQQPISTFPVCIVENTSYEKFQVNYRHELDKKSRNTHSFESFGLKSPKQRKREYKMAEVEDTHEGSNVIRTSVDQAQSRLSISPFPTIGYPNDNEDQGTPSQQQIDELCDMLVYCGKDFQQDKFTLKDLQRLIEHLQRLYFLKMIQTHKSLARLSPNKYKQQTTCMPERDYYKLLSSFRSSLKVIFHRQETHDIYDMIYHLNDCCMLRKTCQLFADIKKAIEV